MDKEILYLSRDLQILQVLQLVKKLSAICVTLNHLPNSEVTSTGPFRQMDPLRFLTFSSFNVHFNRACHLSPCLLVAIFSSAFSTRILYLLLVSPCHALSPTHITE